MRSIEIIRDYRRTGAPRSQAMADAGMDHDRLGRTIVEGAA